MRVTYPPCSSDPSNAEVLLRSIKKRFRLPLLVFLFAALLPLKGCIPTGEEPLSPPSHRIIGYVMGSRTTAFRPAAARRLTHINYAFANVRGGAVVLEDSEDARRLARLTALRRYNRNLDILLSVGGWAWSDHFSDAALTDASRRRFARSAVTLVAEHELDGLDIDWEYPGQRGQDNVFRPEDKQNFTLLLKALRTRLDSLDRVERRTGGDRSLLTIAAGVDSTYLAHTEMAAAQQYLDFVNLMTYDFHGSWTPRTGHHTNLHRPEGEAVPASSVADGVARFLEAGVPPEKLVVGAAFYGRWWSGVTPNDRGRFQPYDTARGALPYDSLVTAYIGRNGFTRHWDDAARAPYLWNPETSTFITYDDPVSLRAKAAFVRTNGLGGMMYWEHSHDPSGTLLTTIYENLQ